MPWPLHNEAGVKFPWHSDKNYILHRGCCGNNELPVEQKSSPLDSIRWNGDPKDLNHTRNMFLNSIFTADRCLDFVAVVRSHEHHRKNSNSKKAINCYLLFKVVLKVCHDFGFANLLCILG